ncbi:hypothetical protein MRB53_038792 [Persea americana]|nr:hypothetical protein MRB53_038792 [Persea americana]
MALVGYSDSEDSDAPENDVKANAQKDKTKKIGARTFQKVVNSSNPRKIQVNLGVSDAQAPKENTVAEERPPKKAGLSGGFNSFLPAPKNPSKNARPAGLGKGFSLKTGAEPSFSRSRSAMEEDDSLSFGRSTQMSTDEAPASSIVTAPLTQVTPQTTVEPAAAIPAKLAFKPLSVARKPAKRKRDPDGGSVKFATAARTSTAEPNITAQGPIDLGPVVPPPKKSLFSTADDLPLSMPDEEEEVESRREHDTYDAYPHEPMPETTPSASIAGSSDHAGSNLNDLADKLNLTPAQRRQLFGRDGRPDAAQVAQFSLAAEYANNNALRDSQELAAAAANPVRTIAPGKHSLQQLLNNAANQKEALEESFAAGRKSKKEAGSRYGW